MKIYYLKNYPNRICETLPNDPTTAIIITVLGVILITSGVIMIIKEVRKNNKKLWYL